jgi:hypothetical protein
MHFILESSHVKMSAAVVVNDDPRLGALIVPGEVGDIVVVGFPADEGVRRNGGRTGAAGAPYPSLPHS